jgi:hypothetical protein
MNATKACFSVGFPKGSSAVHLHPGSSRPALHLITRQLGVYSISLFVKGDATTIKMKNIFAYSFALLLLAGATSGKRKS